MRMISLVCSAFAFTAMTSVAQAEPAAMKQSEPMRLTASQMNNVTAGGVTIDVLASGIESSYSRGADFSITPNEETSITVACCGAEATSTSLAVIPGTTRFDVLYPPQPIYPSDPI